MAFNNDEGSCTKEFEESDSEEFKGSDSEEFEESGSEKFKESDSEEFEENGSEKFKGSDSEEFEKSDSEKFKGSDSEEFEESSIKESIALNVWFGYEWQRKRNYPLEGKTPHYYSQNQAHDFNRWILRIRIQKTPFEFGKSGNIIMDNFILEKKLKWIPYDKFRNVEYLDKGGFGTIYKAIWFYDNKDNEVILKYYNNLSENLNEFLNEWEYHESCLISSFDIIYFYGFTKDPDTLKYMVVMDYANKGNLRGNLTRIIKSDWNEKLYKLYRIISGLNNMHKQGFIHCDFHDGNILNHNEYKIYISDLGLCKPVKSFLKKYDIYGVIPFMAPEVLRGKSYTQASDIYSFSMIMWEFTSGIPPFNNREHDFQLSLSICKGERPEIIENTPQCYVDLMKKCWSEDSSKRPSSKEIVDIIYKWIFRSDEHINEELKCNIMEFINAPIGHNNNLTTKSHPQAYYTSRLLDFTSKELNEILESEDSQASVKVNEMLVSKDLDDCIVNLK